MIVHSMTADDLASRGELTTQADVELAATNAICARLWGVAPDAIRAMAARDASAAHACVRPEAFEAVASSFEPPTTAMLAESAAVALTARTAAVIISCLSFFIVFLPY